MTPARTNMLITLIAKEVLGLTTLRTRRSDTLDFHELSVWQLRRALTLAFEAGRRCRPNTKPTTTRRSNS